MYFESIGPIEESVKFTMKNFIDLLMSDANDPVQSVVDKYNKTKVAFNKYYEVNAKAQRQLHYSIDELSKTQNPVDLVELMKYVKEHIILLSNIRPAYRAGISPEAAYGIIHKCQLFNDIPKSMTTYTYPYILDKRYVIFMTFDENSIQEMNIVCSKNMYDPEVEIELHRLDTKGMVDPTIFKKK